MQIVSINAAQPATVEFNGDAVPTGIFKVPVHGKVQVTRYGIQGDTIVDQDVHGGLDQAVYLYHQEDYHWWSEQLGKPLTPGLFGENLTLSGMADITLVIGDRLTIGNVELEITAPRTPCFKLAARMGDSGFAKKFAQAQRPGAYARVIREGELQVGDNITLWQTAEDFASVVEVFVEWHKKDRSAEVLRRALASPIAVVHRERLQQWHDESSKQEVPRPPFPPFDVESATQKVRMAEDAWNSRDPQRVALAYTPDSVWRNRAEFLQGRAAIAEFLTRKWSRELDYRLIKELWAFHGNRIAVRFAYEWHDDAGNWFRSYGNENWEFDENGFMQRRIASINDLPITEQERKFHWPLGRRPDEHPSLSALGL